MIAIPQECFKSKNHRGRTLVCEEKGMRMVFLKARERTADKIQVDGCIPLPGPACDYLVRDWKGRQHFVELKGKHVEHGLKQIEATIPHFISEGSNEHIWCFVVCLRSSPASLPGRQAAQLRIVRQWNATIIVKTNV